VTSKAPVHGAVHSVALWALTSLFGLRVAAQFVQYASPIRMLPPFDAWQGSRLNYPVLLTSQILILAIMVAGTNRVSHRAHAARRLGAWLIALGSVYFGTMSLRLLLGLTVLGNVSWFAKPLPAVFHVVLASYLLTLGHYHLAGNDRA
jgi:hypothetical protein